MGPQGRYLRRRSELQRGRKYVVTEEWAYQPAFAALQAMPKADAIDAQIVNTAGFEPQLILDGSPTGSAPVQFPKPVTVILFGSGLAGIMGYARKQKSKNS